MDDSKLTELREAVRAALLAYRAHAHACRELHPDIDPAEDRHLLITYYQIESAMRVLYMEV